MTSEILGIFDMDTATISNITKEYLKKAEKKGNTKTVSYEIPKTFIVSRTKKIYFTQISTSSLFGRL